MTTRAKQPSFPTAWIVIAAMASFAALAGLSVASRLGFEMKSHGTTVAEAVFTLVLVAIALVAIIVEFGAVLVGLTAMWKVPSLRSSANVIVLLLAALAILGFLVAIEVVRLWPW